jgi:hypothetical protein
MAEHKQAQDEQTEQLVRWKPRQPTRRTDPRRRGGAECQRSKSVPATQPPTPLERSTTIDEPSTVTYDRRMNMATITTTQPATGSSFKRFIIHHPLVAFLGLVYGISWLLFLPSFLSANGIGVLPFEIPVTPFLLLSVILEPV